MLVMVLESVPPSLKGELSRWLTEVTTGVYVGRVSALVRDLLWDKCVQHARRGRCAMMYRTNTEQGFAIRLHGERARSVVDFEGLQLVAVQDTRWAESQQDEDARDP